MMELFLQWFLPAAAIVCAICIVPFGFLLIRFSLEICGSIIIGVINYIDDVKVNNILASRWYLKEVNQCPNQDYLEFIYRDPDTGKTIGVSHDIYKAKKLLTEDEAE